MGAAPFPPVCLNIISVFASDSSVLTKTQNINLSCLCLFYVCICACSIVNAKA